MKFCSFVADGRERFGFQLDKGLADLVEVGRSLRAAGKISPAEAEHLAARDLKDWLGGGEGALELARKIEQLLGRPDPEAAGVFSEDRVEILPPIPNPGKIMAIGLNYRDHAEEQNAPLPERPLMFAKFPTALTGPGRPIELPSISRKVDPEAELCAVILKTGRGFSDEEAAGAIAGYTAGNDVSARDLQYADKQWVRAKSCDTFAPCGPYLVTEDELGDPHALDIELRLNGRVQQSSNTRNLIFNCYQLVAYLSQAITLRTGDIIYTGTPGGVGVFRNPPVFLQPGDVVEVTIERIGTLRNPVIGPTR